ncbi:MAG TPA: hypothetical protein VGF59_33605 [Bryobacteraceae bacterium]
MILITSMGSSMYLARRSAPKPVARVAAYVPGGYRGATGMMSLEWRTSAGGPDVRMQSAGGLAPVRRILAVNAGAAAALLLLLTGFGLRLRGQGDA